MKIGSCLGAMSKRPKDYVEPKDQAVADWCAKRLYAGEYRTSAHAAKAVGATKSWTLEQKEMARKMIEHYFSEDVAVPEATPEAKPAKKPAKAMAEQTSEKAKSSEKFIEDKDKFVTGAPKTTEAPKPPVITEMISPEEWAERASKVFLENVNGGLLTREGAMEADLRGGAARGVMASGSKDPSGLQGAQMRKATLDKVIAELNTPHQANYATTPVQEVLSIITMATSQLDQASTKELKEEWSTLLTLARRQLKLHLEGKVYERMVGVVEPGQDVGLRAWAGRPYWAVAR